ncbi:MAG: tetratricopeptide repeat protein [Treponema sp.]|jgi:tetratricopeptide (TPR) repeat protein|nr:tetratricopeptide repeat protein [Treponema sp.]
MTAVILILVLGVGVGVFMMIRLGNIKIGKGEKVKDRETILKEANQRLARKPRDAEALAQVGDIYFQEESWDKAYRIYEILVASSELDVHIDKFEAKLRYSIAALNLEQYSLAYKGLSEARELNPDNFAVNYNLGIMEFQKKNYETALQRFKQAYTKDPDHALMLRYLGHSYFKLGKHREAMMYIRKAIDLAPGDKESLYVLGQCYYESNQTDQALRIFTHLRADPVIGPNASLFSGTLNTSLHNNEQAIEDFKIGLKHKNIKNEVLSELKYRLASIYLEQNELCDALPLLHQIEAINPTYKDVHTLIDKYQELYENKNLHIFLMASSADFIALCRKIVLTYYSRGKTKITNIVATQNDWVDITADLDTPQESDVIIFRFIRTEGAIGELIIRDFHSHLKEVKAGKGICMTVGNFTDEAKRFTEARLIDLIEKESFMVILHTLDSKTIPA